MRYAQPDPGPWTRRPARPRGPRRAGWSSLLTALALSTAAAGVALTVAAWSVPRAREAQARGALRDYAAYFATSVLADAEWDIGSALHDRSYVSARGQLLGRRGGPAPSLEEWVVASERVERCGCITAMREPFQFRFDEAAGRLETRGAEVPAALRRWLADTLRVLPRAYGPGPQFLAGSRLQAAVLFPGHRAPHLGIAVRLLYPGDGSRRVAYGYAAELEPMLRVAIPDMMERIPLFPGTLARREPNAALVALEVYGRGGRVLFRSTPGGSRSAAGAATWHPVDAFGGVRVRLVPRADVLRLLRPRIAGGALIPALVATFLVLLVATLATVRTTRREAQLVRARADFLASVSHELRTPLAQILLFADTLGLEGGATGQQRTAAKVIIQEALRLSHLVDNVLHLGRGERGAASIHRVPTRLATLVEEVVDRFLPLADEAAVTVELRTREELVAEVDRDAFTQVLLNLLDNALRHGGPESSTIRVGLEPQGDRAVLWVEDDGPGVDPQARERIWEPFARVAPPGRHATGSGIGLAVVRDLVERHGGDVRVETGSGGGARFVVRLPRAAAARDA